MVLTNNLVYSEIDVKGHGIATMGTGFILAAVSNAFIADKLLELAQFLGEYKGNAFKVRAYRRAARTIRTMGESFDELVHTEADLTHYPGIGTAISKAIQEIVQTGTLRQVEALRGQASPERAALSAYPHLDPKRVLRVFKKLNISSVAELKEMLASSEVAQKMGERTAQYLRQALSESGDILLYEADGIAAAVETFLLDRCRVTRAESAGDYRRRVEVISELSFVVETDDITAVRRRMEEYGGGSAPIRVDLRQATAENWGSALVAATGSAKHLRQLKKRGCSLDGHPDESAVHHACGLAFIEPELREGRNEIELAARGAMPLLVTKADIRGELHAHSTSSDGKNTIGEMAAAAQRKGYEYIGITDHSQSLKIARGLSEHDLWEQIREIDQWNERLDGIRVLKSAEVDILADGTLDYPDELLKELDYTVCSIHSRFVMGKVEQTERILRAMDNRYFTILGHATGRLLLKRAGYEIDMKRIVRHARDRKCFFEINSSPDRLDLSAENARMAAEAGVGIAINTDAHGLKDFDLVRYGVGQARRAGLTCDMVLNCMTWDELGPLLASRRQ
jgi:DNA polymerase (family X)